jgi:hypothetical protein
VKREGEMAARIGVEFTVDVSGVAFEGDIEEMFDLIDEALAAWKPTIRYTTREYETMEGER